MGGGETCAAVLEAARSCLHARRIISGDSLWQRFRHRGYTHCRATATLAGRRSACPTIPKTLLCAFFERGGFAAQVRQNFAGEMQ